MASWPPRESRIARELVPGTTHPYMKWLHFTGTTTVWDLSDDGYYYTDAWLYTGTNGTAVPHC